MSDTASSPIREDPTGRTLTIGGRYRVRRVLGAGGMGVVYEARHNWTGRHVAVKVLSEERVNEEGFNKRFAREARATSRVRHVNVVDVLDSGYDPTAGGFYIVQELLEGEDLRTRLAREGRLAPDVAVGLMLAVTEGLAVAHEQQIVHRDVKPGNIFLARMPDGAEVPKVIDFGVSKLLDEPSQSDTSTGQIVGTPRYMAPEQLRGERDVDARADVWGVGAVLYEALAGRPPFEGANHNLLVYEVLSGSSLAAIADVPEALMEIVLRALERDRDRRFPSMRDLHDALLVWRLGGAAPARSPRRLRIALAVAVVALIVTPLALLHHGRLARRSSVVTEAATVTRIESPEPTPPIARPVPAPPAPAASPVDDSRPTPVARAIARRRVATPAPHVVATPVATTPTPTPAPSSRANLLQPSSAYP